MNKTHQYTYSIRRRPGDAPTGRSRIVKPTATDMDRIAGEVKTFLAFYDEKARAEILGCNHRSAANETPPVKLRIITKIANCDIVDSAVRVSGLPLRLFASRVENEQHVNDS